MSRINELRFIARVAQMYFIDNMRQSDIAKHLRLSQAKVSRLLKRAVEEQIIKISLNTPTGTFNELEAGLREKYHLTEAMVVDCTEDRQGAIMARIGEAAAHYLEETLQPAEIIGVSSWSQTILKMVQNIHPMKKAKAQYVVQILGGMGNPNVQTHATQLTTKLAQLTGGQVLLLATPGVVSSREAKLVLLSDPFVRQTMDQFRNITLAIVGIGAVEPSDMLANSGNVFSKDELDKLSENGAVGDMSLRFFDKDGRDIQTALDDRVVAITTDELRNVDRVVGLAGGPTKTRAIDGALKTNILDVLITDKFTAARLLNQHIEQEGINK